MSRYGGRSDKNQKREQVNLLFNIIKGLGIVTSFIVLGLVKGAVDIYRCLKKK
jgi:hypothetical protein